MKKNLKLLCIFAVSIAIFSGISNVSAVQKNAERDFEVTDVKYKEIRSWNDSTLYYAGPNLGKMRLYTYWIYTSKTSPCPNCKFIIKPGEKDGDWGVGLPFQLGDDKTFPNSAGLGYRGTYILSGERSDWTIDKLGATIKAWFYIGD